MPFILEVIDPSIQNMVKIEAKLLLFDHNSSLDSSCSEEYDLKL